MKYSSFDTGGYHRHHHPTDQVHEEIDRQQALRKLLTMESGDVPTAVDTKPANVRNLMEAALQADNTLTPRVISEGRHSIIHTVLTWQINAHKRATPGCSATVIQHPTHPLPAPDHQPPQMTTGAIQPVTNNTAPTGDVRQPAATSDYPTNALQDILAVTPGTRAQRGQTIDPQDNEDSDDELDACRKRARDGNAMETWIEGFHTGTDAALEQKLSSYPENGSGAICPV